MSLSGGWQLHVQELRRDDVSDPKFWDGLSSTSFDPPKDGKRFSDSFAGRSLGQILVQQQCFRSHFPLGVRLA